MELEEVGYNLSFHQEQLDGSHRSALEAWIRPLSTVLSQLFALAALSLLLSTVAAAQPAFLVKGLNTTQPTVPNSLFSSQGAVAVGATAFFVIDDGIHGSELWKSDGTGAGTTMVKDICPGACAGLPTFLTPAGGVLYFVADDGTHDRELWESDCTASGTAMVADVQPGVTGS